MMLYYLKGTNFNAVYADIEMYIVVAVINMISEKKNKLQPKHTHIYIHTYIHTFHASISVS